jgi:putative phosphonate catabolism associated alcohol dehydrogenase
MNLNHNFPPGRAVIFQGQGKPFDFTRSTPRELHAGEILVQVLYTTLCGSDLHTYCGRRQEPPKVVLGHEIVGRILQIDGEHSGVDSAGNKLTVGDTVTWAIFTVPKNAVPPRADIPQKSEGLFKYGHVLAEGENIFSGGLADYCVLRANTSMLKISDDLPLKVAATISCAHATIAGALRVAGDLKDKRVIVFGTGLLGLSCIAMCKEAGAKWIGAVDNNAYRLTWAPKFGSSETYDPREENVKLPPADFVFDLTGDSGVMALGLDILATGGVAVWIGAVFPNKPVEVGAEKIVRKVIQIRGLHNYNYEDFIAANNFIHQHYRDYPFEGVVEKEFRLDEVEQAFQYAVENKPIRVGINNNSI